MIAESTFAGIAQDAILDSYQVSWVCQVYLCPFKSLILFDLVVRPERFELPAY